MRTNRNSTATGTALGDPHMRPPRRDQREDITRQRYPVVVAHAGSEPSIHTQCDQANSRAQYCAYPAGPLCALPPVANEFPLPTLAPLLSMRSSYASDGTRADTKHASPPATVPIPWKNVNVPPVP